MLHRRRKTALVVGSAVLLLLIGGRVAAEFVKELLWYRSLGMQQVFWTRWAAATTVRLTVTALLGALIFANLWVVAKSLGTIRVRRRFANIEIAERLPQSYVAGALGLIAIVSAWWLSGAIDDPLSPLAALRPERWGIADPIFEKDVAFYVFRLPLLEQLQSLVGFAVVWTGILVASSYVATGAVKVAEGRLSVSPPSRRHLGVLAAAFLLVAAWDLWMDRYMLAVQGHGIGGAPGYTDVNARMPALAVSALLAAAASGMVGFGLWKGRRGVAIGGVALFAVGGLLARAAYPALVQKLVVEPNEIGRESPYIAHHLRFARLAYDLDGIRAVRLPYRDSVALSESELMAALAAAPLWDPRPLQVAFNQRETLYRYYDFNSVHPDRYGDQQVAIGVRELEPSQLPEAARTWQNLHLRYVAGEGAVVSPVTRMSGDGGPAYFLRDIGPAKLSPDAPAALALREPAVYFGEKTRDYIVVEPGRGPVGVPLSSTWRKLVFAWAFQSKNLLLSGNVTPGSHVVYRRQILERVHALAPFLHLLPEGGALPVVHDGRLVWMVDGYTASSLFPLSQPDALGQLPVRYVRNSVKATVDAVSGAVRLYALDPEDPILRTYARIFPGLLRPLEEMPSTLQEHLRYPAQLLALQAEVLGNYHMSDPARFYAREDVWSVATETFTDDERRMEPIFATLRLPGESEREFVLSVPMVPQARTNLAALLVARNDPPHYGERLLYQLPRDELVPGPQQIESRIDQDPEISQQLSLWKEGGSQVIRGHLLVIPVDSTLVYLEPLYLEAQQTAIPQLERVILASPGDVVMRPTLGEAVAALAGAAPAGASGAAGAPQPAGSEVAGPLLERAQRLMQRAEAQLRQGDWAGFGRSWSELRALLADSARGRTVRP